MIRRHFIIAALIVLAGISAASAQTGSGPIKSSAAYAEVLLRKTELQSDLESLIADYTEANPKIVDIRVELASLNKALERIYSVGPSDTGKLTLALGKLIVRKAALETDLARLQRSFGKDHGEVKRARKKVEIFEAAINDILH
jgi:ABC-type Fe3+-hydroxamate transport system substrate-binding protein